MQRWNESYNKVGDNLKKSYYAIIPANVRYDKRLTDGAKLLYGEITALCNQEGYCWASNSYFAELYKVSNVTISKWVNQLARKGYITTQINYKEGTKQILNRYIRIVNDPIKENFNTSQRKLNDPIKENFKDNNTVNTTSNNTSNKDIVGKPDIPYKKVIDYLNKQTCKNYRHTTKAHQRHIKARFNEGFTLDDFKTVIDNKVADNKKGNFKEMYLRPETLFGNKFDGYLNQKPKQSKSDFGYDPSVDSF